MVGITGPPGAGKSTVVDALLGVLDGKVAVLAVDPTSPFTGGALLGEDGPLGADQGEGGRVGVGGDAGFLEQLAAGGILEVTIQGETVDGAAFELSATVAPDEGVVLVLSA